MIEGEHGAYSVEGETDIRQSLIDMSTTVGLRRIMKVYGRRGHLSGCGLARPEFLNLDTNKILGLVSLVVGLL